MKGYMAKKQKKIPVQKRTGTVALLSLFCAAAGVYAESDGWSYNDVEKSVIHAGESHARIAPVKKGEELEDQSKIGNIKKAEISDNASFRYDPALGKDELKGVVFDNESGVQESASLKISEGASLDVDATKSRDGKTDWSGKSAVGVEFAKDTTVTIEAKDASISVKGDTGATAISASDASTKLGSVEIGSVSAKATDSAKAFAINANDADSVKIGSVSGNIKVADAGTVDLGSMQGNIEAANVKDSISVAEKITGNITATSAKDVGIGEISGDVKIDTIGNSVNIGSLDGNLVSTNVGNSSSESSVANITVKSASNTAREVNIVNLAATATISGDEENAEAAKINVGTAEKKLSVNGKVEVRVDEAKGGLSAELKNADANALYVKSVKGGAEIAGEGNVNIVNAEASETPAIKIGDLNGNFAAGFDVSAETSGAIKGDVEIGSISGNTGIINLDGNLTAGTLGADETSTTSISVSGADKTVDITTANGTTTVNGNGSLEAKVGTSNGNLTVSDYKNATIGEVKDGSKLVLNGSDKDAIADVTKADRVEANALGETTIGSANYVKAADSVDASLSIKGQNVKITDASGEYVVDTIALANEGTVEINKGSIANSIDGFNGNVKANETGTIKVEGAGMTGGLDIGKINGDLTSAENAKISGNVNVGEVNKVDVKGGIAAIEGKENTGNLTIGTANDNVAVSGGVAGNMKVADAKKDVAVDTVGKNLTIDMLNGGTVKADEVTETVKVAGTGTVEVTTAGNVDVATTDGKLTIDGQKVSADGSLSIKNTGVVEGGQVHVGAISGDSTVNGFTGDLTVDSNTGKIDVSTIDGKLTAKNAQGDINVASSATEIEATLNGGDLNVSNAESTATVENVAVSGTGNVAIDNNTGSVDVGTLGGKLTAKNAQGDINVSNSVNDVDVVLNGGNLNVTNVAGTAKVVNNAVVSGTGNATIDTAKTIELGGDLTGDITVNTSVETINGGAAGTGKTVDGNVDVAQNTGSITLGNVTGMLKLRDAQGNVDVFQKAGNVDAMLNGGQLTVNEVDEAGSAKVDGQGKAIIGQASSVEANTSNGNLHLDGNILQIEGGSLDVDVANVSKKEDGTVAEVKATGALDSVEIKNVNDSTNVSFNDVTKVNGGTGNVDITDSKLGNVSASGTVEGDFNVTNVEGKIASTGEIQGTTNITDFTGEASFNTVKDVNVNSADPDNKKGLDGSLTIAQGQGAVTFNADAGTVDINLDGGSVTTGLKPNGDAVVLDKANFSGNGTVNVTVDKLESFDQINDSVVIEKNKLSSDGKLNSQITVNSGEFTITNADSITVDGHNENGGRKLTIEDEITDDVTIGRIGKGGVAVAAENATIGGNLDIDTAEGSVTVGTVNGRTEIDTANGDVTVTKGENVTIADANGNVTLGTAKNVTIGDIAADKLATVGTAGDIDINGNGSLTVDTQAGDITVSKRLGGIDAANATVGNVNAGDATIAGDVKLGTAENVKIDTVEGLVKVDEGKDINVRNADSLDLGTVTSVDAGTVANNVDIDNVGTVDITKVGGQTTIGAATDDVSIKTANGDVTVTKGENVTITDANGNVDLGLGDGNSVDNVTIGDIAAGKLATVGTAGDININGKGSLKVENEANNITAGNIKQVSVKTANGDINIVTAEDLTFTTVKGNVNVTSEIKTVNSGNVNVGNVNGDVSIAKNTGNVKLGTVNNLVLSNVAGGSSVVNKVNNKAEITTTTGNATIKESKQLQAMVDGGTLTATTVSDIANVTVNSGTANVGSAKSLDATVNGGSLNVDSVASSSDATVKANGGKSIFTTIAGKLKALLNGGEVEVEVAENTGNVEISGSGDATVGKSAGSLKVETSTADKFVKNDNGGISTEGNLNVAINEANSANFGTVNGGDIVDMTKIDNLTVSESTGILNVGLEGGQVKGKIVIEKATADVNVGNVANLDVTLRNNANLLAIDNTKVGTARVNGGCDASYYNVGTLTVDRSLDGNLEVRGAVSNSADISNVSGTVAINEVASTATASVKNAGSAIVDKAYGKVEFSDFASGSATVNNATANIEATNVAGGLNIGNVADVKVNNTNVNVLDGNTVNGKIESASGMTLSNSGTATIGNSGQIVVNGDLNVASEFKFAQTTIGDAVIKANNLSGSGATKTVDNFFDAKFVFSGDDSVMEAAALKGTHNAGSSYIDANIDDMSVSHTYVDVTYKNTDGSKVGYEITKNSYLSDKFAKSDNEKALAEIYDNLVFQDDATKDAESVQKKKNFKALAENGNIGAMLPQAVNHAARMNMDLSNIIHLDTINRTAYTRDMLNRINYLKAKGKLRGRHTDVLSGASSVTVRNINRFASYSGDGNIAGSNDSVYGGLANAEYVFDDSLFAGIGIGGFQAKSNGKDASGKAETQSFALNAYADYLFYDNFDWYFGLTYAYGMNEAERNSGSSMNKGKWDSNLVGAFTGVRYAWKPIADREFYIKPLLGMNVSFLMNPSFTENGDSERLDVDSEDYTSVKSIAGIEASYLLDCGLSVAGRMFYTHEFADNRYDITSSFIGSGYSVNTFRTLGSELKRDSGIFGIGLGYDINTDWRVYLDYAAEVADDVYHNLNAGVQFKF